MVLVPVNSQIIGIKSQVNKNNSVQFCIKFRKVQAQNGKSNIGKMSFFLIENIK